VPAAASAEPVLRADYESGAPDSGVPGLAAVLPPAVDGIAVSRDFAHGGGASLRSKVMYSPGYVSDGNYRAESNTQKVPGTRYSEGDRFRYRFSVLLSPDWVFDTRDSIDIVFQCKRDAAHADAFVAVKGKDLVLRVGAARQLTLLSGIQPGQWVEVGLDARWSSGPDGVIDAFVDGARAGTLRGPNLPEGAKPRDAYIKWGLYKPAFAKSAATDSTRVVYHDDIVIERVED
jgi:hypothetical protein